MATVSDITSILHSGLTHVDALIDGLPAWNYLTPGQGNVLYYTFSATEGLESTLYGASRPNFAAFNGQQADAARSALAHAASITGIQFVETADGNAADLHFANYDVAGNAAGITSAHAAWSADFAGTLTAYEATAYIYLDNMQSAADNVAPSPGNYGYQSLLHEIGHALGLKHPFEGAVTLPAGQDSSSNTLMSYTHQGGPYSSFQPYDIAALDWLYGADGLGGLGLGPSSTGYKLTGIGSAETLNGAGGSDELFGAAGDDTLIGGMGNDSILAGDGNDWVHGNAGDDTIRGSLGNDDLRGGQGNDVMSAGQGSDTLWGALGDDEIRGGLDDDVLTAGQGNDTLSAGQGNDLLQGRLGNDLLYGKLGADIFWFNAAGASSADTIADFSPGEDMIELDSSLLVSLIGMAGGSPAAGNFLAGGSPVAQSSSQLLLYDTTTGDFYYDPDGSGAAAAEIVATLSGAPALHAEDIIVS